MREAGIKKLTIIFSLTIILFIFKIKKSKIQNITRYKLKIVKIFYGELSVFCQFWKGSP